MNLENTKVYTTDLEVIRKYAELCGKELSGFDLSMTSSIGVYNCDTYKEINDFMRESPVDNCFTKITPDQINALYNEKFGVMAQDNEQLQNCEMGERVEWDGEGLPPVGVECELRYKHTTNANWRKCKVFAYSNDYGAAAAVWHLDGETWHHHSINISEYEFRKPETPQQREERERLEEIDKMSRIVEMKNGSAGNAYKKYCATLYDAGYRKQKDDE